ncbi:hypothetical protein ACOME3_003042 [Neoechinorhynchus agilis]
MQRRFMVFIAVVLLVLSMDAAHSSRKLERDVRTMIALMNLIHEKDHSYTLTGQKLSGSKYIANVIVNGKPCQFSEAIDDILGSLVCFK